MDIKFDKVSKRFIKEWIIRDFSFEFKANHSIAITGANGSGKSTLLKLITGIMPITAGKIEYQEGETIISDDDVYKYMTFCSPYQELIEEFSLAEMIRFHKSFRKMEGDLSEKEYADLWQLSHALNKPIHFYSSGMKQRVKVGLALSTTSEVTLLDEPTSNLDENGKSWYMDRVQKVLNKRTLIIASNIQEEYTFCSEGVSLNVN